MRQETRLTFSTLLREIVFLHKLLVVKHTTAGAAAVMADVLRGSFAGVSHFPLEIELYRRPLFPVKYGRSSPLFHD